MTDMRKWALVPRLTPGGPLLDKIGMEISYPLCVHPTVQMFISTVKYEDQLTTGDSEKLMVGLNRNSFPFAQRGKKTCLV